MPLQTGNWTASFGGQKVQLSITNVSATGQVTATVNQTPYGGLWDDDSKRLSLITSTPRAGMQVCTGYLFIDKVNIAGVNGAVVFTLAGIVENFGTQAINQHGPAPTAKSSSFGWYAQIGVD